MIDASPFVPTALRKALEEFQPDQPLSLQLDQMDIGLVEREQAVEGGANLAEDEPGDAASASNSRVTYLHRAGFSTLMGRFLPSPSMAT